MIIKATAQNPITHYVMTTNQPSVPFLENGDGLTRAEFERRYQKTPNLKKAELIEGVVFVAAALWANSHGNPHALVMAWLGRHLETPVHQAYIQRLRS